jgi:AcrR family transcriptional regulator
LAVTKDPAVLPDDVIDLPADAGSSRGAPRESAICAAALELLVELGYDRMSMDAVAARAHASKATIYRRWPGKRELVLDAIRQRDPHDFVPADTGSLRGDIIGTLRGLADGIGGQDAALLAGVLRAMRGAPELADCLRERVLEDRRGIASVLVDRAVARGELAPGADPGVFHEVAPALMFFRVLVTGGDVDDEFLAHVADDVLVPLLACSGRRAGGTPAGQAARAARSGAQQAGHPTRQETT